MFWSPCIFHGHSTRDPASVVSDDDQGDLVFFLYGPTQELALAKAHTRKSLESFWKKNEGEWTGKVEISKEEIPGSR